jgi:hypothetical protein
MVSREPRSERLADLGRGFVGDIFGDIGELSGVNEGIPEKHFRT